MHTPRKKIRFAPLVNRFLTAVPKNLSELMLKYGGGGHQAAGTCQVPHEEAESTLKALIKQINEDG